MDNALCLCALHHKLFDRGAIGVASDHTVTVSRRFVARAVVARTLVLELAGRPLGEPQSGEPLPHDEHIHWHARDRCSTVRPAPRPDRTQIPPIAASGER